MPQLVLEYVLEGHRRGYNFTSPTGALADETLKTIWRTAMPRGQGWGGYIGARALKAFPLDGGRVAVSDVTITDMRDENGRAGIRRAVIDVLPQQDYPAYLDQRLLSYPAPVREYVQGMPTFMQRTRIARHTGQQLVLAFPFDGPYAWQMIEALIIRLALAPFGPLRRWEPVIPFTTLALDHREESRIVALPQAQLPRLDTKKANVLLL